MNIIIEFNRFLEHYTSYDFWNLVEGYFGIGVILSCIMQRSWFEDFSSIKSTQIYSAVKIGQLGLYIQIMMGIVSIIDAYYNEEYHTCHPLMALWCIGITLTKYSIYLRLFNKNIEID